ncbi:hypothetical protein N7474_010146 [Penicillium riverlandense]|uniref:uncharacterized protein n=1 Tax=Penicillium riverlandense TaxID=1903569 RepID=UPI002546C12D|nr:uncharacterized protein N7474_010146 [Penicillium riverlandense]KAJ5808877.1 hypothetical protein N7474_010146 [Penicillium riverlandense]
MADNIGSGLPRMQFALAELLADPAQLDIDRSRFSRPPSYTSHQSHNSTELQSPDSASDDQRLCERQKWQLKKDRETSRPYNQFDDQVAEVEAHIIEEFENRRLKLPIGTNFKKLAHETVKQRWVEQGIWRDEWKNGPQTRWMHEEPLELPSATEADADAAPSLNIFSSGPAKPDSAMGHLNREKEHQHGPRQQDQLKHKREASRPLPQFIYQISLECKRIQDDLGNEITTTSAPADINTKAYENVRRIWIKRGIWDAEWVTLPGLSWKHERPLPEFDDGPAPVRAEVPEGDDGEPAMGLSLFGPDPISESNNQPSITNPSGRPANSAVQSTNEQVLGPTTSQKKPKASKTKIQKSGQEANDSEKITLSLDTHDSEAQGTGRRRSKRLQEQTNTEEAGNTVIEDSPRKKPRANRARSSVTTARDSAKRRRVSKRKAS